MSKSRIQAPLVQNLHPSSLEQNQNMVNFDFRFNKNNNQKIDQTQSIYPVSNCNNFMPVNQNTSLCYQNFNNQIQAFQSPSKKVLNNVLRTGHKMVQLSQAEQFENLIDLFPHMTPDEIGVLCNSQNTESVQNSAEKQNQKKAELEKQQLEIEQQKQIKKTQVQNYMASQQKRISIQNNNLKSALPRKSKKRGMNQYQNMNPMTVKHEMNASDQDKEMSSHNQQQEFPPAQSNSYVDSSIQQQHQMQSPIQEQEDENVQQQCQEQEGDGLKLTDSPNDKFVKELGSVFVQVGDKIQSTIGSKDFVFLISDMLDKYKNETCGQEIRNIKQESSELLRQTNVLKKGIRIQNKRIEENNAKAQNFDELLQLYKKEKQGKEESEQRLQKMQIQLDFLMQSKIGQPYNSNNNGFNGFGGGIC